jgi:hypothetical protein
MEKALYAVACLSEDPDEPYFFVTFNTRDERKAIQLARCVSGNSHTAEKSLVIVDYSGGVWI